MAHSCAPVTDPAASRASRPMKPTIRIDQTLTLIVLTVLIAGCFLVLQPFLTAIVWAAILCATMWPLFVWVSSRLGGRAGLAALAMVLLVTITLLAPFAFVGFTIAENAERLGEFTHKLIEEGPPAPPATTRRGCSTRRASTSNRRESCSSRVER